MTAITAATVESRQATSHGRPFVQYIYRDQDGKQIRKSPTLYSFTDGSSFSRRPQIGFVHITDLGGCSPEEHAAALAESRAIVAAELAANTEKESTVTADPKPSARKRNTAKATTPAPSAAAEALDEPVAETPAPTEDKSPAARFAAGQTIAEIARAIGSSQKNVRAVLDEAGVDYSQDKNSGAPRPSAVAAPKVKAADRTPIEALDAFLAKSATGDLSAKKRKLADALKGQPEIGVRLAAIGALQSDDPEAFGRALGAVLAFLWSVESR